MVTKGGAFWGNREAGYLSVCSRYHFFWDDGCFTDTTLAFEGVEQCPDGSDEAF
nr:PREDICTED: low-density lipoprotein receptor-related protein 11 [Equus przewalskii]